MFDSQLVANTAKAQHRLLETLTNDSESECRDLLVHLFVNQWPLERIVDDVIAPVFRQIGYLWEQKQLDTYRQRRACQICLAALHEIRLFLPDPPANAPKAICASIAGDHYSLPAMAVELTLVADGWNAASLGSDLPLESFLQAARLEKPALACMSISHIDSESELMSSLNHFAANLPPSVTLVIGGSAITSTLRNGLKSVICCDNMSQLLAIASSLNPLTED
jgi:methanogenic corrinoid protein MtbC1